jgi:hypothetical protein
MVCGCLLLLPLYASAAEPSLAIDLDGDGRHDRVTLDHGDPSVLNVWLSKSDTTQAIRTHAPLVRITVADLDGDHRPELIAGDSDLHIHVWTHKRRKGVHSYRPCRALPRSMSRPDRHSLDDHGGDPPSVIIGPVFAPLALMLCASPRAPGLNRSAVRAPSPAYAFRSSTTLEPFAARPPPTHIPS